MAKGAPRGQAMFNNVPGEAVPAMAGGGAMAARGGAPQVDETPLSHDHDPVPPQDALKTVDRTRAVFPESWIWADVFIG